MILPNNNLLLPSQVAAYDLYEQRIPTPIDRSLRDNLIILKGLLESAQQNFIKELLVHSKDWKSRPRMTNVYVIGSFRSHYRALVGTAKILAEFYLRVDFLPLIHPLTSHDWKLQFENKGDVFRNISNGVVVFSKDKTR